MTAPELPAKVFQFLQHGFCGEGVAAAICKVQIGLHVQKRGEPDDKKPLSSRCTASPSDLSPRPGGCAEKCA